MWPTSRAARRTSAAVLGFVALASFLLPGPSSAPASAAVAPALDGEHPVADPGPPSPRTAHGRTSVAFGDGVHLTAFVVDQVVSATRVAPDGTVLDPTPIEVSRTFSYVVDPVVAFDGTNFLVAWSADGKISGRRVSPSGDVVDASDIVISTRETLGERPAIAFDGVNHLVAWVSPSTPGGASGDIFGRRVSPQGTLVGSGEQTLSADPDDQHHVALAFNGVQHLLVWDQIQIQGGTDDIYGTLVDKTGVAKNPSGNVFSSALHAQHSPAVTAVGTAFFVSFTDNRVTADPYNHIYGTRVSSAGEATGVNLRISTNDVGQVASTVASDGSSVLVTWVDDHWGVPRTRFARIDASGVVDDPAGHPLPAMWAEPGVAFDGSNYLVAGKTVAVRLSTAGEVVAPGRIVLSGTGNRQADPDTASDGTNSLVVWSDDRYGDQRIFGARMGADGQSLDGSGFTISAPTDLLDSAALRHQSPAVAFDGTNYLVVWSDWRHAAYFPNDGQPNISAARVSPSGQVLDRFIVSEGGSELYVDPDVAFGEGVFLVAWEYRAGASADSAVYAKRVSPAGVVLDPRSQLLNEPSDRVVVARAPAVAHGASGFMVVWQVDGIEQQFFNIRGTRVAADGTVTRPSTVISDAPWNQVAPDIAWHDGRYLVVWQDNRERSGQTYGARLDDAGTVLDPEGIQIATGPDDLGNPSVAANGVFFVTWSRQRDDVTDIVGATVSGSGAVGGTTVVADRLAPEEGVVLSPVAGSRRFAVGYERFDADHGANRAYLRYVSPK
jgi:hypothetical protein